MYYFKSLVDAVLPPRCPISGEIVDSQGMITAQAWKELAFIAAPYCRSCGFPFEFAVTEGGIQQCAGCLTDPPEFKTARSALVYNDASRDFILGFKHGDQTHSVVSMVPWLKNAGADLWRHEVDMIVPVPLHRWRLLRRRYNQAALMARAIAREMKIDFIADALLRTRPTPTQGHLNASERQKNVRAAFSINPRREVRDLKVVLVDDVFTTGATVKECVKALKAAGAAEVHILTLARVVRPEKF